MMSVETCNTVVSNSITNKEALRDKIHEIHNFLRNNGAGYGMNALKVFNILYGLKKIEQDGWLDKVNLKRPCCEFSYLLKIANENMGEELVSLITGDVLQSIFESSLRGFLFYEIPKNLKGGVFMHLIKEIEKLTEIEKSCNVLLSGKIYEYFIGRDATAISELGAYFTDRHIVDYIMAKINPSINEDGSVPTMVDMFGGSGGFTTGYINFLQEKYPKTINWTTELSKISHFDMNEDVIKSAALEFFCLTGVLPNMDNLSYKNSFIDEFNSNKFKYILTNPPYGGDKTTKTDIQNKRDKVKEYIKRELLSISEEALCLHRQKQLKEIEAQEKSEKIATDKAKVNVSSCSERIQKFAFDNGSVKGKNKESLKSNDKEGCSLMLIMDMIESGGTAVGVLKEGVFFDQKYKDLRKCLIANFNVREIISVPQDQFENTSTKTSILIFDNIADKTHEVMFRELVVEKYNEDKFAIDANNNVVLIENKGDILGLSDKLVSVASRDELLGNHIFSLNGKDYGKKTIVLSEGYELLKFGDICEFLQKSKRNASFGQPTGLYNFYTSSDKIQKCDIADYNEECLIIGSGGVANVKIDCNFSCSADNFIIKTKVLKYLYFLLQGNMQLLSNGFTGSTLKHVSKDYLTNLQIPVPKCSAKVQEWVDKISAPFFEKHAKQHRIQLLETLVQTKIMEVADYDEVEIGDACEYIKTGKNKTPDNKEGTLYPYYGTADITGYTDFYLFDGNHILLARNGTMGNCFLVEGKIYPSDHIFVIKNNNDKLSILLLYYLIKNASVEIQNSSNGSTIQGISKTSLSQIKLKIPRDKQFLQELDTTFQEIDTLQHEVIAADQLYNQYIDYLNKEAFPSNKRKFDNL
jgi:type I restriction-modification system DNA methylase subunit